MANSNNTRRNKNILSLMIVVCLIVCSCSIKQKTSPLYLLYPGEKLPEYEIDYANRISIVPEYKDAEHRFFDYTYIENKEVFKHKISGKKINDFEADLVISLKDFLSNYYIEQGRIINKNLIEQVVPTRPNEQWVSDITYIGKRENPMYLALVTDAYSKKIVGYDVSIV